MGRSSEQGTFQTNRPGYSSKAFVPPYLTSLQRLNSDCEGAFCGYGVAVKDFRKPVIDFNRNNTYIQSEGINQDFGVYDSPDEMFADHHQELGPVKKSAYRNLGRHLMNRNVIKIRKQERN